MEEVVEYKYKGITIKEQVGVKENFRPDDAVVTLEYFKECQKENFEDLGDNNEKLYRIVKDGDTTILKRLSDEEIVSYPTGTLFVKIFHIMDNLSPLIDLEKDIESKTFSVKRDKPFTNIDDDKELLEEFESPYCAKCGHCGIIGCCGDFININHLDCEYIEEKVRNANINNRLIQEIKKYVFDSIDIPKFKELNELIYEWEESIEEEYDRKVHKYETLEQYYNREPTKEEQDMINMIANLPDFSIEYFDKNLKE